MKLITRIWDAHSSSSREMREYQNLVSNPSHHMVAILLTRAIDASADAICLGFHPDVIESEESIAARKQGAEQLAIWKKVESMLHQSMAAIEQSARTRGPADETGIPISLRIDGQLRYFDDLPFRLYGNCIKAAQDGAAAIGAAETNPQPMRYFEIGYGMSKQPSTSNKDGKRRFAEIDLEFAKDNTFWIHIRGMREIGRGVRVSQSIF